MEFWLDMTRAISAGFEDAFNHLRDTGGASHSTGSTAPGVASVPARLGPLRPRQALRGRPAAFRRRAAAPGGVGGIDAPAALIALHRPRDRYLGEQFAEFPGLDARFAQNFQGFINDYEKAGGQIGPDSGTLGERPNNASGHPIGAAIDINQIRRGVRSKRDLLDPE